MNQRNSENQFVVCIDNKNYRASLVARRIYRVIPDPDGEKRGLVRVVDESGEDYLFPEKLFARIELPKALGRIFSKAV